MKFQNMKYVVKFNNCVGNIYAKHFKDALHDAKSIVSYKYADIAVIYKINDDGSLSPVTYYSA